MALRAHGEPLAVHDLDVVVEPCRANWSPRLLGRWEREPPTSRRSRLEQSDVVAVATRHGRVDLLVRRGRESFAELAKRSTMVEVCGVGLLVAGRADACGPAVALQGHGGTVTDRTGLRIVDVAVLETLDRIGARPRRPYLKSARAVVELDGSTASVPIWPTRR